MNLAFMEEGLRKAKRILKASGLFQTQNYTKEEMFKPSKFSQDFFQASHDLQRNGDYRNLYKVGLTNKDYDILLSDYSFFQFSCESNKDNQKIVKCSYSYYEAPSEFQTYEDFLTEIGLSYSECGDLFRQDYEQYLAEAKLKNSVTPLRYDYDESLYDPPVHSLSHLHIGFRNEIRVPIKYFLTPHSFVSFVIRHIYWNKWKLLMNDHNFCSIYYVKSECKLLDNNYFTEDEAKDFYIS